MRRFSAFAVVTCLSALALAGEIRGVVTDETTGAAVPSAAVTVVSATGQKTVATDRTGHYRMADLPAGDYGLVIAFGGFHIQHSHIALASDQTLELADTIEVPAELVTVTERSVPDKPAQAPEPKHSHRRTLAYTDEAFEKNVWGVAWVLLDVDAKGKVSGAKFYRRPGYGLDDIALAEAWKMTFSPALDAQGKPTRAWVMFKMEWPPLGVHADFLDTESSLNAPTLMRVPCADSGQPLNLTGVFWVYRNCAQPDPEVGAREAWQTPPR